MNETLRDRIAAIMEMVADGSTLYWVDESDQRLGTVGLNQDAVVNDIMEAIEEDDGILEIFGGG